MLDHLGAVYCVERVIGKWQGLFYVNRSIYFRCGLNAIIAVYICIEPPLMTSIASANLKALKSVGMKIF